MKFNLDEFSCVSASSRKKNLHLKKKVYHKNIFVTFLLLFFFVNGKTQNSNMIDNTVSLNYILTLDLNELNLLSRVVVVVFDIMLKLKPVITSYSFYFSRLEFVRILVLCIDCVYIISKFSIKNRWYMQAAQRLAVMVLKFIFCFRTLTHTHAQLFDFTSIFIYLHIVYYNDEVKWCLCANT